MSSEGSDDERSEGDSKGTGTQPGDDLASLTAQINKLRPYAEAEETLALEREKRKLEQA